MKKRGLGLICILTLLLAGAAAAQQKGPIEIKSAAEVEITARNAKGELEVKRVEASRANVTPGDTVIFTLTVTNNGKKEATKVAVKNPVPEHMEYVDKSAEGKGAKIDFSVDKGKTFGTPEQLKIRTPNGKERPAAAADYTVVRWTIEKLPASSKSTVSFRAKVK